MPLKQIPPVFEMYFFCSCFIEVIVFLGLKQLQQLEEDSRELTAWLDAVEAFLQENAYIPIGESEQLDRLLDASNVSAAGLGLASSGGVLGVTQYHIH